MSPKSEKGVQPVPRRIILSRAGCSEVTGKEMVESFSREKLRHAPQKEGG